MLKTDGAGWWNQIERPAGRFCLHPVLLGERAQAPNLAALGILVNGRIISGR